MNKKKRFSVGSFGVLKSILFPVNSTIAIESMPILKSVTTRKWEVIENWHYKLNDEVELIIPKGFHYNGTSIPRYYWLILNPTGFLLVPAILYECGCQYGQIWQVGQDGSAIPYGIDEEPEFWHRLFKSVGKNIMGRCLIITLALIGVPRNIIGKDAWSGHRFKKLHLVKPDIK